MFELRPFTKKASTGRRERGAGKNVQTMLRFAALHAGVESPFAWLRLVAAVVLSTIGSVGVWSVPVVLPAVQAEFGVARADASLPFTLAMIGFACGGVAMGRRPPLVGGDVAGAFIAGTPRGLGLSPNALLAVLCLAGLSCCVAMSMPQVHIVAYCGDLGYGVARGAEMLSLMLGFGIFSRIASGFVADRIGGVATLLLGSTLQGVALLLYLLFDGLASLYVISALFGLFQGGIVPMYAIIVREYFSPQEAGTRLGIVLLATLGGMALGGWMSGLIFDLTGSYQAAFLNGLAWNLVNVSIVTWLLLRPGRRMVPA